MNDNILSDIEELEAAITAEVELRLECVRLVLDAKELGNWNKGDVLGDARAFYNWISNGDPDPSGKAHEPVTEPPEEATIIRGGHIVDENGHPVSVTDQQEAA